MRPAKTKLNEGRPVVYALVATFWRANGFTKKSDGGENDLENKAELHEFWGRLSPHKSGYL